MSDFAVRVRTTTSPVLFAGGRIWVNYRSRERGLLERLFVIPGVAPPRGPKSVRYMREHLPGVVVPETVVDELEAAGADAPAAGVRLTTEIVRRLRVIDGIAGVHVMGLGREESVRAVIEGAGLLPRPD